MENFKKSVRTLKKILGLVLNWLNIIFGYLFYRVLFLCITVSLFVDNMLERDTNRFVDCILANDAFDTVQTILGLILTEQDGLKYSDSFTTLYSLHMYTSAIAYILDKDDKLGEGFPDLDEEHISESVINRARFITGM